VEVFIAFVVAHIAEITTSTIIVGFFAAIAGTIIVDWGYCYYYY